MTIYIGTDKLAPIIAVALDEAWGNRYEEHAVEELATESKHIAQAILKHYTASLPQDITAPVFVDLDGLPVYSIIKVQWSHGSEPIVMRKTSHRTSGQANAIWEVVSDNSENTFADWEMSLAAYTVEIIALGTTLE